MSTEQNATPNNFSDSRNLDAWQKAAAKSAPGGAVDALNWVTPEGITVKPLYTKQDTADLPHADLLLETADELMANGGSCVAAPDGSWVLEPFTGEERLEVVEIDHTRVLQERHSLDVAGHYSRPDVVRLTVDRRRQATADFED